MANLQIPVGLLSRQERARRIERAVRGLYRWYTEKSQMKRNWHVDSGFRWRDLRTDHDEQIYKLIEGFYAVEQYVPDYTAKGLHLLRKSYGRSQFQIRWGAEEEKHADLWRNALLFGARWSPERVEEYTAALRESTWELP
ncbi:MAG: fatty acid desaturase, partial [Dehalococcoidia bacterium]|nr:fatty acid desaturase [Dehalococcoidia bacterium]